MFYNTFSSCFNDLLSRLQEVNNELQVVADGLQAVVIEYKLLLMDH